MTLCSAIWDVILAAIGVFVGFRMGILYDQKKSHELEKEGRKIALNNLVESLKENSRYIRQMFEIEFPNRLYPSYPLDTVALSMITFDVSRFLGGDTGWNKRYNKLRFEMDHINRKLLINFMSGAAVIPEEIRKQSEMFAREETPKPDLAPSHALFGVVGLLLATKRDVDAAIAELARFQFLGYS